MDRGGALRPVEVGGHVGDVPDDFRPERFLDDDPDRPEYAYVPFGGGPRHCIGKRFAMLEATLVLTTIAQEYRLELVDDSPLDLMGSITMHPGIQSKS